MHTMKKFVSLVLVVLLMLASIACTKPANDPKDNADPQPATTDANTPDTNPSAEPVVVDKEGGTLKIGLTLDFTKPLWLDTRNQNDFVYTNCYLETLMVFDKNGAPQPFLAKSVTGDAAEKTYTIVLNEGIKFHDGSLLNAEVCAWNLQMYKDQGVLSTSFLKQFDHAEVVDEYTVKVYLTDWDSTFTYGLARQAGFMHSKKQYDENGAEGCAAHPIGTGPFMFESHEPDISTTFVRFDEYWQGRPNLDAIEITVYADHTTANAALQAGEINVRFPDSPNDAKELSALGFSIQTTKVPSASVTVCFNSANEADPFYDVRVRQAAAYAIDRDAIMKALWGDYGSPITQYGIEGQPWYNDDIVGYEYNPEKAKELLAEAGYPDGFDTKIMTSSTTSYVNVCQIVAEELAAVGIRVELTPSDNATYLKSISGWESGMLYHPMTLSNGGPSIMNANFVQGISSGLAVTSFIHPDDLNDTILSAVSAVSEEEANALWQQAEKMIFEDYCLLKAIGAIYDIAALDSNIHDSGIGETVSRVPGNWTLWNAWIEK
ncbi:MAG: ABC transporter substrate-binding protein [Eubacteriales bacterium]|nr:ABC transporter substrate-binding protein [Eubacteriales bacterium]